MNRPTHEIVEMLLTIRNAATGTVKTMTEQLDRLGVCLDDTPQGVKWWYRKADGERDG